MVALSTARLKELILPARADGSLAEEQLTFKIELISDKYAGFSSLG